MTCLAAKHQAVLSRRPAEGGTWGAAAEKLVQVRHVIVPVHLQGGRAAHSQAAAVDDGGVVQLVRENGRIPTPRQRRDGPQVGREARGEQQALLRAWRAECKGFTLTLSDCMALVLKPISMHSFVPEGRSLRGLLPRLVIAWIWS